MNNKEALNIVKNGGLVWHPELKNEIIFTEYLYLDNYVFDDSHIKKYPIDYFFNNSINLYNDDKWQEVYLNEIDKKIFEMKLYFKNNNPSNLNCIEIFDYIKKYF